MFTRSKTFDREIDRLDDCVAEIFRELRYVNAKFERLLQFLNIEAHLTDTGVEYQKRKPKLSKDLDVWTKRLAKAKK